MPLDTTTLSFAGVGALAFLLFLFWYLKVGRRHPRLDRDWTPDCARLPTAKIEGYTVTLSNVRHFHWHTEDRGYDVAYADETYDVHDLVGVWYVVDHFHKLRGMAHVMLSFEFTGERYVTCSFETRRVKGQRYHPWNGIWRGYELLLVWGGEEDLIQVRTHRRGHPVFLFPCAVPEGKAEALFLRLCRRTNELAKTPEWYHTLKTTCSTSLVRMINQVTPGRVPIMWRLLLPGHTPSAAYRLGLLKDEEQLGYEATLAACAISDRARAHGDGLEGYSQAIRSRPKL
jgi:hypothetical protein